MSLPSYRLPIEILHIVLLYLSSDFRDLILFASLCKEWKEAADHSLVWLSCDLRFSCPLSYYQFRTGRLTIPSFSGNRYNDRITECIEINQTIKHYSNCNYIVAITRSQQPSGGEVEDRTSNEAVEYIQSIDESIVHPHLPNLPQLQAKITRDLFMAKFVQWHRLWHWYVQWQPVAKRIEDRIDGVLQSWYGAMSVVVSVVCHVIACYMFWDMKNVVGEKDKKGGNSFRLGVREHIGFGLLYMYLLVNGLLLMMLSVRRVANQVVKPRSTDLSNHFQMIDFYPTICCLIVFVCSFSSLLLFHIKLTFLFAFPYVIIPLPLWVGCNLIVPILVVWMRGKYNENQAWRNGLFGVISLISLWSLLLGLTLLALFYDGNINTRHQFAEDGPVPLFLTTTVFAIRSIHFFIKTLLTVLSRGKPSYQRIGYFHCDKNVLKKGLTFFRFIISVSIVVIFIYFNIHITSFNKIELTLAQGFLLGIVLSLLLYMEVLCISIQHRITHT